MGLELVLSMMKRIAGALFKSEGGFKAGWGMKAAWISGAAAGLAALAVAQTPQTAPTTRPSPPASASPAPRTTPAVRLSPRPETRPARAIASPHTAGWAQLAGDLPLDPAVTMGVLPNGMRYLIQKTEAQPGRAALRLVINAGSMQEQPDQMGLAHFLEHMAFRGSERLADGEMQMTLERLGLRMGADTNASTGPDRTIYKFNLTRNDDESLDTGLMLMREIASKLTLNPSVMERERGVIQAELRLRDGPMMVLQKATFARQVGDHPYGRSPGGLPQIIQTAPVERMRAFYDAYYRPERGVMVVVGDVDPQAVERKIRATFADWAGRGPAGTDPGPVTRAPDVPAVEAVAIPGMPFGVIQMQWYEPYTPLYLTKAEQRKFLVEVVGAAAVQLRMSALVEAQGRPAAGISTLSRSRIPEVWSGWGMAGVQVNDPAKTVTLMTTALRQARQFGITQVEMGRVIAARREALRRAVAAGSNGTTDDLADEAAMVASANQSFQSPEQELAQFEEMSRTLTLAEVNASLRTRAQGEPTITYFAPEALPGGAAVLKAAYDAAKTAPIAAYPVPEVKPWPYTDFGTAGRVAERREDRELGVTMVRFENNVRLTIKPTTNRRNDLAVRMRVGRGRLDMPLDRMDATDMGPWLWYSGGLGRLTRPEQQDSLLLDSVSFGYDTQDDAFALQTCDAGCLQPDKLDRQMQLFAAMIQDPAFRTDEWAQQLRMADEGERSVPFTASSQANWYLDGLMHSGDPRWVYNNSEMRRTWRAEDAVAFMRGVVANGPIEVIVVGDVRPDAVIQSVAKTLGALRRPPVPAEQAGARNVRFPAGTPTPMVITHKGPRDQGMVYVAWPTPDQYTTPREYRARMILGTLLRGRVIEIVRSIEGKTYSPVPLSWGDRIQPGYGYMGMGLDVPAQNADQVLRVIDAMASSMTKGEVTEDEMSRAVGPTVQAVRAQMQDNGYWLNALENAQTDPRVLDFERSQIPDLQSLTAADVRAQATQWLRPETAWRLKVVPEGSAGSAGAVQPAPAPQAPPPTAGGPRPPGAPAPGAPGR
jgi:zinc protease